MHAVRESTSADRPLHWGLVIWAVLIVIPLDPLALAGPAEDGYIAGYAASVLEKEFHLLDASVRVQDGVVVVIADGIHGAQRDRLMAALRRIRGVRRVEVLTTGQTAAPGATPPDAVSVPASETLPQWLPRGLLFDPFHADPRWPHFAGTFRHYLTRGEGGLKTGFEGAFGETFALYRNRAPFQGQWELGLQAGVFSLFNLGSSESLLTNSDYLVGPLVSYRSGDWSAFLRYLHQSSHLGDDFLLNTNATRITVSYEVIDAKVSYDLFDVLRLYGGGGSLVRRDPGSLKTWRTEYGAELQSPRRLYGGIRPVAYADFQTNEQNRWSTNVSLRTGLQFENLRILDRTLQLLVEYYSGYSPNGQFSLTNRIQTIGIGFHLYF